MRLQSEIVKRQDPSGCFLTSRAQNPQSHEEHRAKGKEKSDHQEGYVLGGSVPRLNRRMRDAESVNEYQCQVAQ